MQILIPAKIIDQHHIYVEDPLNIQEKDILISTQPRYRSMADVLKVGRNFLEEIDWFLANNYMTLKCSDIYRIYYQFFQDLKELKGNANGFTGLSEYLLFRFLYHQLGGSFKSKEILHSSLQAFSCNSIRIGQSIPVNLDAKTKRYPDIVLYLDDKLIDVVQIKVYLTNGLNEIEKEMETLQKLKELNPQLRALLVIYGGIAPQGKIKAELDNQKSKKDFFDFLILDGNDNLLNEKLRETLALDRLTVASPNSHVEMLQ